MNLIFRQLGGALSDIEDELMIKTEIINNELHIELKKWELEDDCLTENEVKDQKATKIIDEFRKLVDCDFDYSIEEYGISISII